MPESTTPKKSDETRSRILEAALSLFRTRGFEATTMRDISKEASVALGAAYYYFESKDALVMAFYERAQHDLSPLLAEALGKAKGLEDRLHAVIETKFEYFAPNRKLLGALSAHIDPKHPLSPFGEQTMSIRQHDIVLIADALEGAKVKIPSDLNLYLPRLLWLYQMGLMLFWVYDSSPRQERTQKLFAKTLSIVVRLVKLSSLSVMRPVRKVLLELLQTIYGEQHPELAS